MMNIRLIGVPLAELEAALKYSGLYVDMEGDEVCIKAIPAFLLPTADTQQWVDWASNASEGK